MTPRGGWRRPGTEVAVPRPQRSARPARTGPDPLGAVLAGLGAAGSRVLALAGAGCAPGASCHAGPARWFDVVVAAGDVLGRSAAPVEQEHLVHRVAALLRPGGHLVVQAGGCSPLREDLARWASAAGLRHRWTTVDGSVEPGQGPPPYLAVFARQGTRAEGLTR